MTAEAATYLRIILAITMIFSGTPAYAVAVDDDRLQDPALEARARTISKSLRCLVCQNQSIEDSNADLAKDLRQIVRERILLGETDDQIRAFVVARYGDWVLLRPPLKGTTIVLWSAPLFLFVVAIISAAVYFRRRKATGNIVITPLNAEERDRLKEISGTDQAL